MAHVIDADAHLIEGLAFVDEALERWPDRVQVRGDSPDDFGLYIEGRRYPETRGPGCGVPVQHGLCSLGEIDPADPAGMLRAADREGIDVMVLFPSLGLATPAFEDVGFASEFARALNRYMADFCRAGNGRLRGVGVVPIEDPDEAIRVMTEAKELGLVCTHIPPALRERNLDHPDLDRFYSAAEDLDMPLAVHGAPGVHLPKIGTDRFTNYIQVHCVSFPFDQMFAATAMVTGGVFERHPRLRVAFVEAGVGWLPYLVERLHEHYEKRADWIPGGWKRDPREYLARGQIYVTCEGEDATLPGAASVVGEDCIMFASDFPHWDSPYPHATESARERKDIGESLRRKLLGENASRFFGLR